MAILDFSAAFSFNTPSLSGGVFESKWEGVVYCITVFSAICGPPEYGDLWSFGKEDYTSEFQGMIDKVKIGHSSKQ